MPAETVASDQASHGGADVQALRDCIAQCVDARTGHGRRWAKQRAHQALVDQGTRPWLAAACATAAEQVALAIKSRAA